MSALELPKWGTCGDCRWYSKNCLGLPSCSRFPGVPSDEAEGRALHHNATCGEWEPPEGKVCGNCGLWGEISGLMDPGDRSRNGCTLNGYATTASLQTCPNWRWRGPDDATA